MWHKRISFVLTVGSLIGVGIWLFSFGWTHVQTARRLEQGSAVAEGRVISSLSRPLSKGGQSLTLVVEYKPASHAAITKEFDVGSADYKNALENGKARVTYLPDEPQVSRVTEFSMLPFQILIGLGGVMLLSGLSCLWLVVKRHRQG